MTGFLTNRTTRFFSTLVFCAFPFLLHAQPSNDQCSNALLINDIANFCSEPEAYSNINSSDDPNIPLFNCPSANNNDVWFRFVATAPAVSITVTGRTGGNFPGGSLRTPEVQLLFANNGDCNDLVSIECDTDNEGNHFVSVNKGGLVPGNEYLIRVQGRNNRTGTFQLCINNYTPAFPPESDCSDSHLLCDKSSFFVEKIVGAGNDQDEASGSCLDGGIFANSESNSTWYKWIAANDGTLTFTLTPENPEDDLDFALYELPDGIDDCNDKALLRCMASGENRGEPLSNWIRCTGATGLSLTDEDMEETAGCQSGDNNFLEAITMQEGKAYALLINNFSETENGFTIEFGGTGEFLGPQPEVELIIDKPNNVLCVGEAAGLTGVASSFLLGEITNFQWTFGAGATPAEAEGAGTHEVFYETPGEKTVILTLTTNLGCIISEIKESIVIVEPCCETVNGINGEGEITDVICGDARGAIDLTATSASRILSYQWSNNQSTEDISDLSPDEYAVTVTNLATCTEVFTFPVDSVAPFKVETDITKPTCNGGTDGAITLNVTDGFEPIQIDFGGGFSSQNTLPDLSVGDYSVTVEDGNGCAESFEIEVRELVLELDSSTALIQDPSCAGFTDGNISLTFVNGLAPYSYDWNDGNGFVTNNTLPNIPAGVISVNVLDQNLCRGDFQFTIEDPNPLNLILDALNISCAGLGDGQISALVEGGTGTYSYSWSNGQNGSIISNLVPDTYTLTVVDANQCETESQVLITEPSGIDVKVTDIQDVLCFGEPSGAITVEGTGGNPAYEYSIDGILFQNSPSLQGLIAGNYTVTIKDMRGCTSEVSASIDQPEPLIVDAGQDITIDLGFSGNLIVETSPFFRPVSYSWSSPEFLSCSDCPNPVVSTPVDMPFVVTITDKTNCTAVDSVLVFVNTIRPIYIPSAFSPNLDGNNDRFTIYGGPATEQINELKIFDRWGNLVFDDINIPINDTSQGWDGFFNGKELPPGVYAFVAKVLYIDGVVETIGGDVTLVK